MTVSPEGREWYARKAREAEEEKQGIYIPDRAARLFRQGVLSFDDVIQAYREKRIRPVPLPFPRDTQNWDEMEANAAVGGDPFLNLISYGSITQEQYNQIKLARSGYIDDGDPRNQPRIVPVEDPLLTRHDDQPEGEPLLGEWFLLTRTRGGSDVYAVVRADRGIIYRWQPRSKVWLDSPWHYDAIYGPDKAESIPVTAEEGRASMSDPRLFELTPEVIEELTGLMSSPKSSE